MKASISAGKILMVMHPFSSAKRGYRARRQSQPGSHLHQRRDEQTHPNLVSDDLSSESHGPQRDESEARQLALSFPKRSHQRRSIGVAKREKGLTWLWNNKALISSTLSCNRKEVVTASDMLIRFG